MKNNFYKGEINLEITFNHFIKFKPLYLKKKKITNFSLHRILPTPIFEDFKNISSKSISWFPLRFKLPETNSLTARVLFHGL